MAVVLRLSRKGRTHRPTYKLLACDSRKPLNGAFIEDLGTYDPLGETHLHVDLVATQKWLDCGATPSKTVAKLLRRARLQQAPLAAGSVASL